MQLKGDFVFEVLQLGSELACLLEVDRTGVGRSGLEEGVVDLQLVEGMGSGDCARVTGGFWESELSDLRGGSVLNIHRGFVASVPGSLMPIYTFVSFFIFQFCVSSACLVVRVGLVGVCSCCAAWSFFE